MKNVAVMCALPSERNTGMATVDLAAHAVLSRLFPQAAFTYYTLGKLGPYAFPAAQLPFAYVDVAEARDAFFAADAWLYWGDFMHAKSYWDHDRGGWDKAADAGARERLRHAAEEVVFLKSQPEEALHRAMIFGGTILTNEAADGRDESYARLSHRLFAGAGAVYFRDALSAASVAPLRGTSPTLACDCALLLEDDDLAKLPGFTPASARQGLGVFFARSPARISMLSFSRMLAKSLGTQPHWLPWFPTWGMRRLEATVMQYKVPEAPFSPGEILSQLSACAYVVTDTYHLAVNAWRMGIPAVCIGAGARASLHSLSDKKKEILYEMLGARRFYVFTESLGMGNNPWQQASILATRLKDEALVAAVRTNLAAHRDMGRARLSQGLHGILA